MKLLLLIFIGGLVSYGAYHVVIRYRAAEGTTWERILATAKGSASILWQYIIAAGGLAITAAALAADFFGVPEVRTFIQENLNPEYVGPAMVGIAIVGIIARLRTL